MRTAVILAGGASRRLGAEKSLLLFDGKPLLCWTVQRLSFVAEETIVVARDEAHSRRLEKVLSQFLPGSIKLAMAWDSLPGYGPVAGIAAGLQRARGEFAIATACDLPFLSPRVVEKLFITAEEDPGCGGAVPVQANGFFEPLHCVYHREKMRQACEKAMAAGERRIFAPLQEIGIRHVAVELLRPLDADLLTFFNLNTREDMERAVALWEEKKEKKKL
ncbi:MAG TPA: molybdenum cofactor guanylyltransferase [Methanothrix sp.]|nr:molybdenum cofactor guanylyltransferase [Methanothrix sp.]